RHAGDEAVRLYRPKNLPGVGIDLVDLPAPIVPNPQRPLSPRKPRVTTSAGRRNRGEHSTGLCIDLLDPIFRELIEMLAVERRSRIGSDVDRALHLPARRVDGVQLVARREPDVV